MGFDPDLPATRWRVVGTWVETRGGQAPEGATFEGRHDPAAYLGEPTQAREQLPTHQQPQPPQPHDNKEFWKGRRSQNNTAQQ